MRVQHSTHIQVMNLLKMSERAGWWKPLILVNGLEGETQEALEAVFRMHQAPLVDIAEALPDQVDAVGDCLIQEENAVITVRGTGGSFMGMRFETNWGPTHIGWREEAEWLGHVWFCLATAEQYTLAQEGAGRLPALPLLKLEAMFQ